MIPKPVEQSLGLIKKYPKISSIAGLLILLLLGISMMGEKESDVGKDAFFNVVRGDLLIDVKESGSLQNRDQVVVMSEVQGRRRIIFLADEGLSVEEGDLLVELDSSELVDREIDQSLKVENAESQLVQSRESLEITKNQAEADRSKAELDVQFAKLDLKKYTEGEYPMQKRDAESSIALAEQDLRLAEDKCEWSVKLEAKGLITRSELESDQLSLRRKELDVTSSKEKLRVLENYTHTKESAKLESDLTQAKMALERVKSKVKADVIKAEASLRANQSSFERQSANLERLREQVALCKISAPAKGMVVHAKSGWGRRQEALSVGSEVGNREELIYLPTAAAMDAAISVRESSLPKLKVGQIARITIDALPEDVFQGSLQKIALLPDNQRNWLNPDLKVFKCAVELDSTDKPLRPGMSCEVTLVIDQLKNVLYVPEQAVVRIGKQTVVYLQGGRNPKSVEVVIGQSNGRMVEIVDGLEEGQRVLLAPPLEESVAEEGNMADFTETGSSVTSAPKMNQGKQSPPAKGALKGKKGGKAGE